MAARLLVGLDSHLKSYCGNSLLGCETGKEVLYCEVSVNVGPTPEAVVYFDDCPDPIDVTIAGTTNVAPATCLDCPGDIDTTYSVPKRSACGWRQEFDEGNLVCADTGTHWVYISSVFFNTTNVVFGVSFDLVLDVRLGMSNAGGPGSVDYRGVIAEGLDYNSCTCIKVTGSVECDFVSQGAGIAGQCEFSGSTATVEF